FQDRSLLQDPRPRLSASQQTQILSDVQQHQHFTFPDGTSAFSTQLPSILTNPQSSSSSDQGPFSSLARYKVDRKKQNQQIQQQLISLQQRIQQQQQLLGLAPQQTHFNDFVSGIGGSYQTLPPIPLPNIQTGLGQPFFNEQQNQQLQEYYEKQRQLEALQRQREQLLLEQQELRRQQELLRIQQEKLRTTLLPASVGVSTALPPLLPTTVSPGSERSTTPGSSGVLPTARKITPSENDIFLRAIATHQKKFTSTTPKPVGNSIKSGRQERVHDVEQQQQAIPKDLLNLIQSQQGNGKSKPQIKVVYQTEKPSTSKSKSNSGATDKDLLLKQLKIALSQSGTADERNVTTREIVLPNGKKVQVIQAPNGIPSNLISSGSSGSTTTIKPPKAIFDELTKGVLPPGADFEVLHQNKDGKIEDLGKNSLQNQPVKKVTFVVLEEQPDGSYKVQGVKGNADKDSGTDVDSIVERIKKGELKLPPPSTSGLSSNSHSHSTSTTTTRQTSSYPSSTTPNHHNHSPSISKGRTQSADASDIATRKLPTTAFRPTLPPSTTRQPVSPNSVSTSDKYVTSASSIAGHVLNSLNGPSSTPKPSTPSTTSTPFQFSTGGSTLKFNVSPGNNNLLVSNEIVSSTPQPSGGSLLDTNGFVNFTPQPNFITPTQNYASQTESLSNLLRREGLFAMAKYLRQSGLDGVLNETGPYTIFVPTDKAFRTLLVQLGGPEKAEQKFRENPRLLSGLLLHHVVPGAFKVDSLQDEMTGVSLAGTQLRVNVYSMHDHEWNDIKVTTINGARVAPNKRDVEIPQGLAHAIDRVMFPLPVGDLVQTLQADRERRFTSFLRLLHASGLEDMLSGAKTFTVFAPTDAAFAEAALKSGGGNPVWQESDGPDAAKDIVLRHIIPTTLYTAGMRYYHQKETLRQQQPLQIQKTGGELCLLIIKLFECF
ncbi:hypothetical protein QAD02_023518, partial [Eretmocerus hayati]